MPFWPLSLIKRLVIGRKILPSEEDGNMTDIEDSVNDLHGIIGVVLKPNGDLKDDAVSTASIKNRNVTLDKLAFLSSFYSIATGTGNAIAISFDLLPLAAYSSGLFFQVRTIADSVDGAVTLAVDGLAPVPVKVAAAGGLIDPPAGALRANGIYLFSHDGNGHFILENPTQSAETTRGIVITGPTSIVIDSGILPWTTYTASPSIPVTAKSIILQLQAAVGDSTDQPAGAQVRIRQSNLFTDFPVLNVVSTGEDPLKQFIPYVEVPINISGTSVTFDYEISAGTVSIWVLGFTL